MFWNKNIRLNIRNNKGRTLRYPESQTFFKNLYVIYMYVYMMIYMQFLLKNNILKKYWNTIGLFVVIFIVIKR